MTLQLNVSSPSLGLINPSVPSLNTLVVFSARERKGATAIGVAALTSCILVSVLLLYIIVSAILSWTRPRPESTTPFLRKQVAIFVICLFVADLIQSISGVLELKWAAENKIYEGTTCTTQAGMILLGDLGSSIWSCVIAAYTFSNIALGKQWSRGAVYTIVFAGWAVAGTMTAVGPTVIETPSKGPFFGITGGWCSITSNYSVPRLGIKYVPWLVSAIIIPVLYILVFLFLRGNITFLRAIQSNDTIRRERVAIAKRMLWYPAAFLACISPITIIRIVGMRNDHIPYGFWTFGVLVVYLLGAVDSVIYATTRILIKPNRGSLLLRSLSSDVSPRHSDNGYYGYPGKLPSNDVNPGVDKHRTLDISAHAPWNKESKRDGLHSDHEASGVLAVRVTLERIREVM